MSKKSSKERLRDAVGCVIQDVHVESLSVDTDAEVATISVGIRIEGGRAFVLSCAGDGTVSVRDGQLSVSQSYTHVRKINNFTGAMLESVEFCVDRIVLTTAVHQISMINDCDEMRVMVDSVGLAEFLSTTRGT